MGRPKFLLSRGKEKTSGVGGGGGEGWTFPSSLFFFFPPAPRDFLIDFQGYVSNLFFSSGGLANESTSQCFSSIPLNSARFRPLASDPAEPRSHPTPPPRRPPPLCPLFSPLLSLKRREEVTLTQEEKKRGEKNKKTCISRQDACADSIDPWLPLKHLLCLTDFRLLDSLCSRMNHRCLLKCHPVQLRNLCNK